MDRAPTFLSNFRQWRSLWIAYNVIVCAAFLIGFNFSPGGFASVSNDPAGFAFACLILVLATNMLFLQGPILETVLKWLGLITVPSFRYSMFLFGTVLVALLAFLSASMFV